MLGFLFRKRRYIAEVVARDKLEDYLNSKSNLGFRLISVSPLNGFQFTKEELEGKRDSIERDLKKQGLYNYSFEDFVRGAVRTQSKFQEPRYFHVIMEKD